MNSIKCVILGDTDSKKTELLLSYVNYQYLYEINNENKLKYKNYMKKIFDDLNFIVEVDTIKYNLNLYDTAGNII